MEMEGLFVSGCEIMEKCLTVVFCSLIESSLEAFTHYWNTHRIRESRHDCVSGIPDDLFDMPEYYGKDHTQIKLLY